MAHIKTELRERLTLSRYEHVLRVAELAKVLAKRYGISEHDAEQAALYHDVAKCMDKETLRKLLKEANADKRLFDFHHELWHGPVGAMIAEQEFGVTNPDVLNAVRYHTTGRAGMSSLEKVIFIADLIEPGRTFPGVEELREKVNEDIEEAMAACIAHSISYLVSRKAAIFPDSFECYNECLGERPA